MKIIKVSGKISNEEKETLLNYDYVNKVWRMDSTIPKHFNKALRQNWTPTTQYVYEDGSICGMILTAPTNAITIRDPSKKRVMSEKQMKNLHGNNNEDEDE